MTLGPPVGYDGKSYSGKEFRFLVAAMYPTPGVVSGFGVTAQGSPNTTVQVAAGNMIVAATAAGEFGSYQIYNDATLNSGSFTATTTNPRWDYLILRITAGVGALQIVQGTPSGSPVAPTITGDNFQALALIKMPASTTNITGGMITDARSLAEVATGIPPGALQAYSASTAPPGWLFADGSAQSRTTYSRLFTAIGTAFGAGDGSTTFNLPDLRGRIPVGLDNQGGSDAGRLTSAPGGGQTLGGGGGEENHALSIGELAAHSHTDSGHAHQQQAWSLVAGGSNTVALQANAASSVPVGVNTVAASAAIQNTGSGTAHNNMPPYLLTAWIIKT